MILKSLWRDARSGELTVLVAAIVVAVVIVTSISLFAERLQKALVSEASVFLAADMVLQSSDPVNDEWFSETFTKHLRKAEVVQFASMVYAGDDMYLASVKAVSSSYPLLGNLEVSNQPFSQGVKITGGPQPGETWLDSRLLNLLNLHLGDLVWIGEKSFVVKKVLTREPDAGSNYWALGPRILIHMDDLKATGVVQPGSRVEYRYLFAGDKNRLDNYTTWLKPKLQKQHRLLTLHDSQPGLSQALLRAENFLLLVGSLGVLLASIAIAMAARRYSERRFDAVAIMKTMGATPNSLSRMVLVHLCIILLVSVALGWLLGGFIQYLFLYIMHDWLPVVLPPASLKPYATGALTGLVCTLVFVFPSLWQLRRVPPLRVLRRDLGSELVMIRGSYGLGAIAIFLLMVFYSNDFRLTLYLFFGTLFCALLVASIAWFLLHSIRWLGTQAGSVWRFAIANLRRKQWQVILQLVMFGLTLMLLLVSILIRQSIISDWQNQLPEKTPNHFLINVAEHQVTAVEDMLTRQQLEPAGFFPMVRGRLSAINHVEATSLFGENVDEVYRDLNLTWSDELPSDNQLVSGLWWDALPATKTAYPRVSIEQSLAKKLHVSVGDQLTFTIAGQPLIAVVASVRELSWDRMRPNFYFIFEPGALDHQAVTYITSFYLPKAQKLFLNDLLKTFPTISIFEVDEMIARIQKIVGQITQAIELVMSMILVAGALVLLACIQSSLDQRMQENALLRTLGAGRRLILGALLIEFGILGLVAGTMAALGSEITAWALQTYIFKMDYHFHLWLWLLGPAAGMVIIGVLGVAACAKVVRVPPLHLFREYG